MPVKGTSLLLASTLALMVVLPFTAAEGAKRVLVRYASQFADDATIHKYEMTYKFLSQMNVVYAQCGVEWSVTPDQKRYLAQKFESVSRDYLKAFEEAYQAKFYAPSPQALVDDYVKTMADQQQKAVNAMAADLTSAKCKGQEVRGMLQNLEIMRLQDAADAAKVPAKPTEIIPTMPASRQQPGVIPPSAPPVEEPTQPDNNNAQ